MKKIGLMFAAILTLSACDENSTDTESSEVYSIKEAPKTTENFALYSNGNWENQPADLKAYISQGLIEVARFDEGKKVGSLSGAYNPTMKPETTEQITVTRADGSLQGIKVAALVSSGSKISIRLDEAEYQLTREKIEAREIAPAKENAIGR